MKIKNVSGSSRFFGAGRRGVFLANNATGTVEDSPKAVANIMAAVARKELEIVDGAPTSQVIVPVDSPEGYRIDVSTVADGNTITIEGVVFEFDSNSTFTAGNTQVVFADDASALTALKAAINASDVLKGKKIFATDINTSVKFLIVVRTDGDLSTNMTVSKVGSPITLTRIDGVDTSSKGVAFLSATASTTSQYLYSGLKTVTHHIVQVRTAAGLVKAYDGAVTITGGTILLDAAGSTDIANTDVITVIAFGVRG